MKSLDLYITEALIKKHVKLPKCNFINLGLPSGTLWADHNIGANEPEEVGDYYAWGETEVKSMCVPDNYKFDYKVPTKYNNKDHFTLLKNEDDAIIQLLGLPNRMPTRMQADELVNNTTISIETISGIKCVILTSKINKELLIIPCGGSLVKDKVNYNAILDIWTSSKSDDDKQLAFSLSNWFNDSISTSLSARSLGMNLRAVQ